MASEDVLTDSLDARPGKGEKRSSGPAVKAKTPQQRTTDLDKAYNEAVDSSNWQIAAEFLNGFNRDDMLDRLSQLTERQALALEQGATDNPRVGRGAEVARVTRALLQAIDPSLFSPAVFPNNFGDRLGPTGGTVIAALAGYLAFRLAVPLLVGAWRQIQITAGIATISATAQEEEKEIAALNVERLVERLAGTGGPQRILVTYQTEAPLAERELYLTSQETISYADAVAHGRRCYELRIPERLFQELVKRQLIDLRQGSMAGVTGDDFRIAPGAMQFLAKYAKERPLK